MPRICCSSFYGVSWVLLHWYRVIAVMHRRLGICLAVWLIAPVAEARGSCYGDCSGMGLAVLAAGPFVFVYYKLWNRRKGGPSLGQAQGHFLLACAVSIGVGYFLLSALSLGMWIIWPVIGALALDTFGFLIHPRRYELRK